MTMTNKHGFSDQLTHLQNPSHTWQNIFLHCYCNPVKVPIGINHHNRTEEKVTVSLCMYLYIYLYEIIRNQNNYANNVVKILELIIINKKGSN